MNWDSVKAKVDKASAKRYLYLTACLVEASRNNKPQKSLEIVVPRGLSRRLQYHLSGAYPGRDVKIFLDNIVAVEFLARLRLSASRFRDPSCDNDDNDETNGNTITDE